jgi:DNA-binding response OmpR family regulator
MGNMEINILVVDDNHFLLGSLQTILEMKGYIVSCLDNCKFLEDAILLYSPNVILLDIMLNKIDVCDVFNNLKVNPATREIPVIMICASHETFVIEDLICQVEAFTPKHFEFGDLVGSVERLIA